MSLYVCLCTKWLSIEFILTVMIFVETKTNRGKFSCKPGTTRVGTPTVLCNMKGEAIQAWRRWETRCSNSTKPNDAISSLSGARELVFLVFVNATLPSLTANALYFQWRQMRLPRLAAIWKALGPPLPLAGHTLSPLQRARSCSQLEGRQQIAAPTCKARGLTRNVRQFGAYYFRPERHL